MADVYRSGEIAQKLGRNSDWFYDHKRALLAKGMPAPLALPGQPRWSKLQIDAWLAGVDQRAIAGRLPLAPANDAAPSSAPEGERWVPFLRQIYAGAGR